VSELLRRLPGCRSVCGAWRTGDRSSVRADAAIRTRASARHPPAASSNAWPGGLSNGAEFARKNFTPQGDRGIGGNATTVEDEIKKLRLVVETAREVWGSA
jgi:hypothetical protein